MSMKNFNDAKRNRPRDFPACSAVPQPTAPPRTLHNRTRKYIYYNVMNIMDEISSYINMEVNQMSDNCVHLFVKIVEIEL